MYEMEGPRVVSMHRPRIAPRSCVSSPRRRFSSDPLVAPGLLAVSPSQPSATLRWPPATRAALRRPKRPAVRKLPSACLSSLGDRRMS